MYFFDTIFLFQIFATIFQSGVCLYFTEIARKVSFLFIGQCWDPYRTQRAVGALPSKQQPHSYNTHFCRMNLDPDSK
jgi:hypothetical protein